jgi:hypothetical protein
MTVAPDRSAKISARRGWDGAPLPREALCVVGHRPERATWMVAVRLKPFGFFDRNPGIDLAPACT